MSEIRPNINLQPHLGRVEDNYKPGDNMYGYLALAKIIKVHHKNYSADVMLINTRDVISSDPINEGRLSARMGVSSAHYNEEYATVSGVMEPLQENQLVVVAFLEGMKSRPIILCSFHNPDSPDKNMLPYMYPLDPNSSAEQYRESLKYLRVFPSQAYHRVDGEGGMEFSHPSRTFLKIDADQYGEMTDAHNGFDHQNLEEKDPRLHTTYVGRTEGSRLPVNLLFVHRTSPFDQSTTWTKFFLRDDGMLRFTRDNADGTLTYQELSKDGTYIVRRQVDSDKHMEGSNYTQTSLSPNGEYKITRAKSGKVTEVVIAENGEASITHGSGSFLKFTDEGDIVISAARHIINQQGAP